MLLECSDKEVEDIMQKWDCPRCGGENEDDPEITMLPMCGHCGLLDIEWEDILQKHSNHALHPTLPKRGKAGELES